MPKRKVLSYLKAWSTKVLCTIMALEILILWPQPTSAAVASITTTADQELARTILSDARLGTVRAKAEALIASGFTAGNTYGGVFVRDLNTFVNLATEVLGPSEVAANLIPFFILQGRDGDIIDWYGDKVRASALVDSGCRFSPAAPSLVGCKATVEIDQESSLIQAVTKYVNYSHDYTFLRKAVAGRSILDRMDAALSFVHDHHMNSKYGLLQGVTTIDWGDVQPESVPGTVVDQSSHPAISIYANAMFVVALNDLIPLVSTAKAKLFSKWRDEIKLNARLHLWDSIHHKYIAHLYIQGSPFAPGVNEDAIIFFGGTAIAMEAQFLTRDEVAASEALLLSATHIAGAQAPALDIYPPYPTGSFRNSGLCANCYQNGLLWPWFGARFASQLVVEGYPAAAYSNLSPMLDEVIRDDDFFEYYSLSGKSLGSAGYKGSAGSIVTAIDLLRAWAEAHR